MKWTPKSSSLLPNAAVPLVTMAILLEGPAPAFALKKLPLLPSHVMLNPAAGVITTRALAALRFGATLKVRAARERAVVTEPRFHRRELNERADCCIGFAFLFFRSRFELTQSELRWIPGAQSLFPTPLCLSTDVWASRS